MSPSSLGDESLSTSAQVSKQELICLDASTSSPNACEEDAKASRLSTLATKEGKSVSKTHIYTHTHTHTHTHPTHTHTHTHCLSALNCPCVWAQRERERQRKTLETLKSVH